MRLFKILCITLIFMLYGCAVSTKHSNPEIVYVPTIEAAERSAEMLSMIVNGKGYHIYGNSMYPNVLPNDVVVAVNRGFDKSLLGKVVVYKSNWTREPVCHRLILRDFYGYMAMGDNNSIMDPQIRINKENYLGEVVTIYRSVKK